MALANLIQRLKTDVPLRLRALELLDKVRSGPKELTKVNDFVTYLEKNKPHFYDGTKSTLCYGALEGGPDGLLCNVVPEGWFSVQREMKNDVHAVAFTWKGLTPPHVFFRPAYIGLEAQGENIGNESLIFHEVLHAWTGLTDDELRESFDHLPAPSCTITEKIRVEVLAGAPALNSQVAYPSCIPTP
jgi:hypothetical protein